MNEMIIVKIELADGGKITFELPRHDSASIWDDIIKGMENMRDNAGGDK